MAAVEHIANLVSGESEPLLEHVSEICPVFSGKHAWQAELAEELTFRMRQRPNMGQRFNPQMRDRSRAGRTRAGAGVRGSSVDRSALCKCGLDGVECYRRNKPVRGEENGTRFPRFCFSAFFSS